MNNLLKVKAWLSPNWFSWHMFLFFLAMSVGSSYVHAKSSSNSDTHSKKSFYRYISESEKKVINRTGEIPNTNRQGVKKSIPYTDRKYNTAGRADSHLKLPSKPSYVIKFDPKNVTNGSKMKRVDPKSHPKYGGKGGGTEAHTSFPIKVNKKDIKPLKGAPKR